MPAARITAPFVSLTRSPATLCRSRCLAIAGCLLVVVAMGLAGCARQSAEQTGKKRIAVIPKSMSHVFWTTVEQGAKEAGSRAGVDLVWKSPLKESDRGAQIDLVQQFVADDVAGIVLAPLDSKALVGPVQAARQAGIPVVIIDSGLDAQPGQDFVSFVGTNNSLGGRMGGEEMVRLLNGKGKVVLLRYMAGSASTTERETGFLSALQGQAGIEVISENRFAGTTAGEGQVAALNMIDVIKQADAVFCPNESSTDGMLQALRKEGLAGKVTFVGFDASPPLVEALRNGEIQALVVQNPRKMGSLGVQTLLAHLAGQAVEANIDTGAVVVTRENMDQPEIRPLLP